MPPQTPITALTGERRDPDPARPTSDPIWIADGDLVVRLARDADEVRAAQRTRFEVFTLELQEGLADSAALGLDVDPYDAQCDHLLLIDRRSERVVGTYRVQSGERARAGIGFYCDQEFVLDDLPSEVLSGAMELGRACVLADYRTGAGLFLLWRGLVAHALLAGKRYMFGCCSLTGVDPLLARLAERWLDDSGYRHPTLRVRVRDDHRAPEVPLDPGTAAAFRPPRLFASYLRYSTRVLGGPALDREFGTTDFFVLCDLDDLNPRLRRLLVEG